MKKSFKWLLFVMAICLLATPVLATSGAVQATLNYRDISITIDGEPLIPTDVNGKVVEPFIIDGTTYVPIRAISEAFGCDVQWDDATSSISIDSGKEAVLMAGAGTAAIKFDKAMFPIEGLNGEVNDDPHARVLIVKNDVKVVIASLELVNVSAEAIKLCKGIISDKTGAAEANIWIHATHAITTPHAPSDANGTALYLDAVEKAITEATDAAVDTYQEAVMGIGTSTLDVNANRDIELNGAWYYGLGSDMPSNKTMTILRFDSLAGEPIGFFLSYGIKPTCIDNVGMSDNLRKLSSDVPGYACTMMEDEFGAPALFFMPAAGDQIPKETAMFYEVNAEGVPAVVQLSVDEGIALMEKQGKIMGDAAIELADSITCDDADPAIAHTATSYKWANKAGDGEVEIVVEGIQLGGDVALVGLKPETNAITELELWEASPYKHTLIVSFLNGDQKYMPDDYAYELQTWEFKRAGGAVGCAEEFVRVATNLLDDLIVGKTHTIGEGAGGAAGTGDYSTVEFGGYTWYALEKRDGKTLLLSKDVLEYGAYNDANEAVTWETCSLRAYLNNEFYKSFSAADQAKIVPTSIENKSNSKYGIAGGNATTDSVFLLSLQEAETYLFGFTDLIGGKDKDRGELVWWHLRSPGEATNVAACVSATGLIDYHGVSGGVTNATGGIRPAMWVELG